MRSAARCLKYILAHKYLRCKRIRLKYGRIFLFKGLTKKNSFRFARHGGRDTHTPIERVPDGKVYIKYIDEAISPDAGFFHIAGRM